MSWPLASHFSAMLQNPKVAFRDPKLQQCTIEKDEKRQPRPWAGAFAVVYKGIDANGRDPFAVRVFTTESPERRERYDQISAYLKTRKLNCVVDFEYRDQSIRSAGDGKWYPLIVMEWVQGETLFKWVRAQCLQNNRPALGNAAERWVALVAELNQACIAHGDLQHANIMVTGSGELKLVDYDCMCVPALVGRRNLEVGVEPYQHPGRNEHTLLALDLDNFSALMIYVGLRALAADTTLWQKYVEQTGYDKLLFRMEDFQTPSGSAVYGELMNSPDSEVRDLTEKLFSLFRAPIDSVSPLSELANSFAKVEQLLAEKKWAEAVEILNRRGQFRDAPNHLKRQIRRAYEYVCRQEAWESFQKIPPQTSEENDRKLVDTWNEKMFAGFEPAERQRVRVAEARRRVTLLDRLYHMIQQSANKLMLAGEQGIVDMAGKLPQGYQYGLRARVERAKRCVGVLSRLESALANPLSEAAIVAAWRAAEEGQWGSLIRAAWRPRIETAEQRAPLLRQLHNMPENIPRRQRDQQILEIWQDDLLADCREAARWQEEYAAAAARKDVLARLQAAVENRDDAAINALLREPSLAGFPLPAEWAPAIKAARQGRKQAETLLAALRDGQKEALPELFDARVVRFDAQRFAPYNSVLRDFITTEVLSPEKLGLRPVKRGALKREKGSETAYRVRWNWPESIAAEQCLLAICFGEPVEEDKPDELTAYYRASVDRESWEADGASLLVETQPDWAGGYVVVWAVIDPGFETFYSAPLVLGVLGDESRSKWKPWRAFGARRGEVAQTEDEPEPE